MSQKLFPEYWEKIDELTARVQRQLGYDKIHSPEALDKCVNGICRFNTPDQAFIFFNESPYQWHEFLTLEMLIEHGGDLKAVVSEIAVQATANEVMDIIKDTDAYRFLSGEKHVKKIPYEINGEERIITLRECWKHRGDIFRHLPARLDSYQEKTLTVYHKRRGDRYSFLLEHEDPSMIWRSRYYDGKPSLSIDDYENLKVETLLKHGCPEAELWLTEVQTVEEFNGYYSTEDQTAEEFYDLFGDDYVVYYHESGEVHMHGGFSDLEEFEKACKLVADHLK